jgi:hypothetical protein
VSEPPRFSKELYVYVGLSLFLGSRDNLTIRAAAKINECRRGKSTAAYKINRPGTFMRSIKQIKQSSAGAQQSTVTQHVARVAIGQVNKSCRGGTRLPGSSRCDETKRARFIGHRKALNVSRLCDLLLVACAVEHNVSRAQESKTQIGMRLGSPTPNIAPSKKQEKN